MGWAVLSPTTSHVPAQQCLPHLGVLGRSVGMLLVVTVFGNTDGIEVEVVLAVRNFQNPVVNHPLRNI